MMETFFTEVVSHMQPPSEDVKLVVFSSSDILSSKLEVHKHLLLCAEYAQKYEVYLVSNLLIHNDNLCLCLISPKGEMLCRQAAVHLSMALGPRLKHAALQQVTHTELGNIALCVDSDSHYPEVLRTAALKGADLVICIQHLDPAEDTPEHLMVTAWNAAQTNNFYVLNFSGGGCSVTCPAPLTRNKDGYLVRRTRMVPVRFGFNLDKLDEVRASLPLLESFNTRLIQAYQEELKK